MKIQFNKQFNQISHYLLTALTVGSIGLGSQPVKAEGSKELTANGGARPYLEWRNDLTGQFRRRNILKVYAEAGETINLGSSAIDMPNGNILLFDGGANLASHPLPPISLLNCKTAQPGNGILNTRAQELAGPLPNSGGYTPCTFAVPTTGIYQVVFYGPDGATGRSGPDADPKNVGSASNSINTPVLADQNSSVAMWDVTVRRSNGATVNGRLYSDYIAMNIGSSGRELRSLLYIATQDGYRYRADMNGLDPFGFIFFANSRGIINPSNPLLSTYQSGANGSQVELPTHRIFFNDPDFTARTSSQGLGFATNPIQPPAPTNFTFTAGDGGSGNQTIEGAGGTFSFNHTIGGNYQLIVDLNRNTQIDAADVILDGSLSSGNFTSIVWNGRDRNGNIVEAAPTNPYPAMVFLKGGEYHFPMIDVEKNPNGIKIKMLSLPLGSPGFSNGKNDTTVYFDDTNLNDCTGICDGRAGIDSTSGAHTYIGSDSGFGDSKTIDTWIYFPSDTVLTNVIILKPPPSLRLVKRITGIKKAGATSVTTLSGYVDNPAEVNDNPSIPWAGGASNRLQGIINTLPANIFLAPQDELEYTIYFLSDGNVSAQSVSLCDFIPQHQTFVNGSIRKQIGNGANSPVPDGSGTSGDGFYPTVVQPACTGTNNGNGSIVLDVGTIPPISTAPTQGYGQFSFRAKVK